MAYVQDHFYVSQPVSEYCDVIYECPRAPESVSEN